MALVTVESADGVIGAHEMAEAGLGCQRQVALPIVYDGVRFPQGCLKLSGLRKGLLINFSASSLKQGL